MGQSLYWTFTMEGLERGIFMRHFKFRWNGATENPGLAKHPETLTPTMARFEWTPHTISPASVAIPGNFWCVRDAVSALMGWPSGSEEWSRFIELPIPEDVEHLMDHLDLPGCDPERQRAIFETFLDHGGLAVYNFHACKISHMVYQPHLRHLQPLPPEYDGIDAELFRVYADLRTPARNCPTCMANF